MTVTIFVGNLDRDTVDEHDLFELFTEQGVVVHAVKLVAPDAIRRYAFIVVDEVDAEAALRLNGLDWHGRQIYVKYANEKTKRGGIK